jgi:hypothetical protein
MYIFAVTKREKVNETLTSLNSQHPKIQFTFEIEENGRIPFLDVMVEHYTDRLVFDVYRKPTKTIPLPIGFVTFSYVTSKL